MIKVDVKKMKSVVISVYDKTNIELLAEFLLEKEYKLYVSDGTFNYLCNKSVKCRTTSNLTTVSHLTNFPEILSGRVKTLHPKIYGGILAKRDDPKHLNELETYSIPVIDAVICNLYPFEKLANEHAELNDVLIENIDIGGVSLIRASAKNYKNVLSIVDPNDYTCLMDTWTNQTEETRKEYAKKAFHYITQYDLSISTKFGNSGIRNYTPQIPLKYGCNPHQDNAHMCSINGQDLPFKVLNGDLGYINILDAINSWLLVSEVAQSPFYPDTIVACASFKHTSPAGVAVNVPKLTKEQKKAYMVDASKVGDTATSYLKARYADPKSSFGDFVAISGCVDEETALYIKREVGDGIVAKCYTDKALEILKSKKNGKYIILQATEEYDGSHKVTEYREMFGMALSQSSNVYSMDKRSFDNIVTKNKTISEQNKRDMVLANTTLKYTQSNSISFAVNGQVVGIGAGQQNRVDCVKLAGNKALVWYKRQCKDVVSFMDRLSRKLKRQEKINSVICYIEEMEMKKMKMGDMELCLASDAFFPFSDNIMVAKDYNVKHVIQPGGSLRDESVIEKCDMFKMTMTYTGKRLFTH